MARKKRSSRILENAERRLAAISSISYQLDLGNGYTIESYRNIINKTRQSLANYNTQLSKVDQAKNEVEELEKSLSKFSESMLASVGVKFGKDSDEYEMAGGKPRGRKKQTASQKPESELVLESESLAVNSNQPALN